MKNSPVIIIIIIIIIIIMIIDKQTDLLILARQSDLVNKNKN